MEDRCKGEAVSRLERGHCPEAQKRNVKSTKNDVGGKHKRNEVGGGN